MGKSFDNAVDVVMAPFEQYSKIMSMSDDVLPLYFEVLTDVPMAEIAEMKQAIATNAVNPKDLKMRLAREIVAQFHTSADAQASEAEWVRRFSERELPSDIPDFAIEQPTNIVDLMVAANLASSKSEARRLIDGGGVRIAGEKVDDYALILDPETPVVAQVGRRKFVRVHRR